MAKPAISDRNLVSRLILLLLLALGSGAGTQAAAQELRDLFRQVKSSVVTVRTIKREITPAHCKRFSGRASGITRRQCARDFQR